MKQKISYIFKELIKIFKVAAKNKSIIKKN